MKSAANKDAISSSVEYIESRLSEKIDMDELAKHIFFSKTHYQRLFHKIVGEPVMEYIKKRRLQQACQTLCQSDSTILDIALQYGYASHEGFTRAFKALYGVPPIQFRKMHILDNAQKTIGKEVFFMLSNEVTQGILNHTKTIIKTLVDFKQDLDKLFISGEKAVVENDPAGCGVKILIQELKHFSGKVGHVIESVKEFTGENQSVYEVSDTVYSLMKTLDDVAFQANLLRFLSGIEVARTGDVNPFDMYQKDLVSIIGGLHKNYFTAIDLLKDLLALLLSDIRKDAIDILRNAYEVAQQSVNTGKDLIKNAKTIATEMNPYGAGFMRIASDMEKQTDKATNASYCINFYSASLEKTDIKDLSGLDKVDADRAIHSLENTAFNMNLIAFNTSVETARAALSDSELADKIREYAYTLHKTYTTCTELFKECSALTDLITKSSDSNTESMSQKFQKIFDDIIFQGGILTMQLRIEAARWNNEIMLNHSKKADVAVKELSEKRKCELVNDREILLKYKNTISELTSNLLADAEANMPHGLTFAYIAKEFEIFIHKLDGVLEYTKK